MADVFVNCVANVNEVSIDIVIMCMCGCFRCDVSGDILYFSCCQKKIALKERNQQ